MNYAEACRIGPALVAKYYRPQHNLSLLGVLRGHTRALARQQLYRSALIERGLTVRGTKRQPKRLSKYPELRGVRSGTKRYNRIYMRLTRPRAAERHKPAAGEITMKQWLIEEAARIGLTTSAVFMRLARGRYPDLQVRRVNRRVAYVKP